MLLLVRVAVRSMFFKFRELNLKRGFEILLIESKQTTKSIYGIPLLIYIVCSILLWLCIAKPQGHYDVDSYGYDPIALHFANTGTLTDPNNIISPPIQPVGYHFFLGMLYRLFGYHFSVVVFVQIMLMVFSLILLISIAQKLFGNNIACVVGLLASLNLGFLIYPQLILAETLLLFLLLLFMHYYIRFLQEPNMIWLIYAGLILALSMMVKPVVLLFIIPLLIITYMAHDMSFKIRMRNLLLLSVCFSMPLMAYMGRNYVRYGAFAFAPMTQLNMYQCFLAKVISAVESVDQQDIIETKLTFTADQAFDQRGWDQARLYFYYYISHYPHMCVYIWIQNVLKTCLGLYSTQLKSMIDPPDHLPTHSFFNQSGSLLDRLYGYIVGATDRTSVVVLAWIELFYNIIRLIGASLGLLIVFNNKQKIYGWFFLSMMISFSIVTGIDGCCRYRITFEPILLLLAAIGLVYVYVHVVKKIKEYVYEVA